jgi:hypothetical protein
MRKDSAEQKAKEIKYVLEAGKAIQVSLGGESICWNPDSDHVSNPCGEELSSARVFYENGSVSTMYMGMKQCR